MIIRHQRFSTAADLARDGAVPDGAHADDLQRARLTLAAACGAELQSPSVEASERVAAARANLRRIMNERGIL